MAILYKVSNINLTNINKSTSHNINVHNWYKWPSYHRLACNTSTGWCDSRVYVIMKCETQGIEAVRPATGACLRNCPSQQCPLTFRLTDVISETRSCRPGAKFEGPNALGYNVILLHLFTVIISFHNCMACLWYNNLKKCHIMRQYPWLLWYGGGCLLLTNITVGLLLTNISVCYEMIDNNLWLVILNNDTLTCQHQTQREILP